MKKISDDELQELLAIHKSGKQVIDLSYTDLSERDLSGAYLEQANLENASFAMADLRDADLRITNLSGADFTYANLTTANLAGANLTGACLRETLLSRAQLQEATLVDADLTEADLKWMDFREADLSGSIINGANFFLSAFDAWIIEGIRCTHVYWDQENAIRNPPDRDFLEGEFEQLYKSLPTIDYYFEDGFTPIDALLIEKTVSEIYRSNPEFELELESYQIRGALPRMRMTVKSKLHKEIAYAKLKGRYEELAQQHQEQRKQIADFTIELIANQKTAYNIEGDLNLKNTIRSRNSNVMVGSPGANQTIHYSSDGAVGEKLEEILKFAQESDEISKLEYGKIHKNIESIKSGLAKPADRTRIEDGLNNLGNVASISGLVGQLVALL